MNNQGKKLVISESEQYNFVGEYDGSDNLIYAGFALPGVLTSEPRWKIMKLNYTGTNLVSTQRADGNKKFDNVWDDRATLSYS